MSARFGAASAVIAWAIAMTPHAASAQSDTAVGTPDSAEAAEIIVTAQRRSESVNSIPMSITAVSGDQLQNVGVKSTADLQKIVPGFQFAQGDYGAPIYTLRGIGFNDNSLSAKPAVALSIDEIPLPFPVMAIGANLDVQRVEVLKGPQGTLYGQNATGGAINYIAAKPTATFEAGVNADYGRFNAAHLDGFISGPLSNTVRARIAGSIDHSDGWQKSYTRNDRLGRQRLYSGRAIVDWDAAEDLKAELSLSGSIDKSETTAAQLVQVIPLTQPPVNMLPGVLNYPKAPRDNRAADWDPNLSFRQNNKLFQAALRLEYAVSPDVKLTSISSYSHFKLYRPIDLDGMSFEDGLSVGTGALDVISQELRLSGSSGTGVRWIVGGNYEYNKVSQDTFFSIRDNPQGLGLAAFGGRFNGGDELSRQKSTTVAAFANVDVDLSPKITLHGGLRYTRAVIKHSACTADNGDGIFATVFSNFSNFLRSTSGLPPLAPLAPGSCITLSDGPDFIPQLVKGKLTQDNVSWRAGADYKPADGLLFYANVSKGYKQGSFPNLSGSAADQYAPVVQESVLAYEAGFKTKLAPGVQLNGAAFYYDYRNKQLIGKLPVPVFGPLDTLVNIPKSSITGAELQAIISPVRGLTLVAGGTYIKSRIKDGFTNFDGLGVLGNFGGQAFPLTPKWQYAGDAQYQWGVSETLDAFVGGSLTYQSSKYGALGELPILKVGGYPLVDLRAGVKTRDGRWRLSAWGRNVFDRFYSTNIAYHNNTVVRLPGRPATYGLSAALRY